MLLDSVGEHVMVLIKNAYTSSSISIVIHRTWAITYVSQRKEYIMIKQQIDMIIKYIESATSDKVFILTEDGKSYCANRSTLEEIENRILKEITDEEVIDNVL